MSIKITEYVERPIFTGTSFPIRFDCMTNDVPAKPLPVSSVNVYVFLSDIKDDNGDPIYINDRDGSNRANLSFDGNTIIMDLMPADNALVIEDDNNVYSESHAVLFEIFYNNDTDSFKTELIIKVERDPRS